jgi:hypothetical protein
MDSSLGDHAENQGCTVIKPSSLPRYMTLILQQGISSCSRVAVRVMSSRTGGADARPFGDPVEPAGPLPDLSGSRYRVPRHA